MANKIPFSPLIPLVESYIAIYKIYILKNPLKDNEIFYVGQTNQNLETRLSGHISETGANRDKINYIKEILNEGSRPIIESVEVIKGTCYVDKLMVNERELYWIKYYKALGCKLLNSAGTSPNARCGEYHGYLASIKRRETSWHYYYCGKTIIGDEVYDEVKLKADGFVFPKPNFEYPEIKKEIIIEYRYRYPETIKTEVFPEQPAWSAEFLNSIPQYDIWDDLEETEDDCDLEDDLIDNDTSDFEVEYEEENEEDEAWYSKVWSDNSELRHPIIDYFKNNPI